MIARSMMMFEDAAAALKLLRETLKREKKCGLFAATDGCQVLAKGTLFMRKLPGQMQMVTT